MLAFAALFGLGETFMAPSMAPLVNALAPEHVRGRANALSSGRYSLAFVIFPAISAGFIAADLSGVWIPLLAGGCLIATIVALRLGRRLSPSQDVAHIDDTNRIEPQPATWKLGRALLPESSKLSFGDSVTESSGLHPA